MSCPVGLPVIYIVQLFELNSYDYCIWIMLHLLQSIFCAIHLEEMNLLNK